MAGIRVEQVSVNFTTPGGDVLPALGPVSFQIEPGQFVCLVGPSGCGKSTLIRVLAGLQPLTSGRAFINERPVEQPSPSVGLMFQNANLMPWRTVQDNIGLPLELAGAGKSQRHEVVESLLERLGLSEFANAYPAELSGGMAQRAALGRLLAQEPTVLLLDEPFGALDALTREKVSFDLMRVWAGQTQTVLMVTHDIQEAVLLADRVFVMSRRPGRLVADIAIPFQRPRAFDVIYDPAFTALTKQVRESIADSIV
ncbi:MAG: ABC transporter ATP-binding protein [bacterium]|nr:ABC transporter ATP-binding protein [bacterium]